MNVEKSGSVNSITARVLAPFRSSETNLAYQGYIGRRMGMVRSKWADAAGSKLGLPLRAVLESGCYFFLFFLLVYFLWLSTEGSSTNLQPSLHCAQRDVRAQRFGGPSLQKLRHT